LVVASPNFSFLPYSTAAIESYVELIPVHKSLNRDLPACHKCPKKKISEKLKWEKEYQPLEEVLKTPSEPDTRLSKVNI
jgi:hypothetical protein